MILKPKKSNLNDPAILFKRWSVPNTARVVKNIDNIYKTDYIVDAENSITQYWSFSTEDLSFNLVDYDNLEQIQKDNIVEFTPTLENPLVYTYSGGANAYYLVYVNEQTEWRFNHYDTIDNIATTYEILDAKLEYNDKQYRYSKNLYYNAGYFDYITTGSIDNTITQPVKGLMLPTTAKTIRTDDDIDIQEQDLAVIDGRLYGIESVEISQKKMPRPYNIQYLTLNNIL